jgi:hypothetical protein
MRHDKKAARLGVLVKGHGQVFRCVPFVPSPRSRVPVYRSVAASSMEAGDTGYGRIVTHAEAARA